ncbi:MAG: hypothetical protein MUC97_15230 [Bernardetiaceae bacterium]|jgi:hypothetical protein|nr:hypothetical protein [Bernardetiaceae bacterium]
MRGASLPHHFHPAVALAGGFLTVVGDGLAAAEAPAAHPGGRKGAVTLARRPPTDVFYR